jgi:hypothetical protein
MSPLTQDHLVQIQNALDVTQIAKNQIEMAKRAGLDVSRQEAQLREAEEKLLRIKNVYFPGA